MPPKVITAKPPIADLTVQERVLQAVTRAYELMAEHHIAVSAIQTAKQAEDGVRAGVEMKAVEKEAASVRDATIAQLEAECQKEMQKIEAVFQAAKHTFDVAASQFNQTKFTGTAVAKEKYAKVTGQAEQKQKMEMATAHAAVYRAEREAVALQATIDQHKKQVQEAIGIDLSQLVV